MAKPIIHSNSSAKRYGGNSSDYISIHETMDSSKSSFPDNRHRAAFHHIFGTFIIEKMFGINYESLSNLQKKYNLPDSFIKDYEKQKEIDRNSGTQLTNSEEKKFCPRDIAEQHILEDFRMKFIPSIQDYLENMEMKPWMNNGLGTPSSAQKLYRLKEEKPVEIPVIKKEEDILEISHLPDRSHIKDGYID